MGQKAPQQPKDLLISIEERQVDFYGDNITAALVKVEAGHDPEVFVALRPICEYLGLAWSSQLQRVKRDEVLNEAQGVFVMNTPGGRQQTFGLKLKYLPGWLFGIDTARVRPELREKIIRYRRECYDVLGRVFAEETSPLAALDPTTLVDDDLMTLSPFEDDDIFAPPLRPPTGAEIELEARFEAVMQELAQTRDMGLSIARLSEQHMELERQLHANITNTSSNTARLEQAARVVGRLQRRLETLEGRLDPQGLITSEQSVQVSTMVKALAEYMTGLDAKNLPLTGAHPNRFQSIFAELYRRFGVPNYKTISLELYPAVLKFLDDWKQAADLTSVRKNCFCRVDYFE